MRKKIPNIFEKKEIEKACPVTVRFYDKEILKQIALRAKFHRVSMNFYINAAIASGIESDLELSKKKKRK